MAEDVPAGSLSWAAPDSDSDAYIAGSAGGAWSEAAETDSSRGTEGSGPVSNSKIKVSP